jgi:hypothetical protein
MPNGWELQDAIVDEQGNQIAAVIYWPWSESSCSLSDIILTRQLAVAGYTWDDVRQNIS